MKCCMYKEGHLGQEDMKLLVFTVFFTFLQVKCQDYSRVPLGLSNGFVKNDQFTATSQYAADNYAYTARLKLTGIRWCSVNTGTINYTEYVQVDFRSVVTLTGVATQGDDNYAGNYPKKYYLEISLDGALYTDVKGMDGNRQVFTGNSDNTGIVYNWLDIPTNARYVRFRASDASGTHVCVRLEFYGDKNSKAADKTLYPLGLESGVIEDSQLSHSSEHNGNPAQNGRLNKAGSAWCILSGRSSEWLQIDFKQPMVVTAIATQGHGGGGSKDRTYKYYLQYREVGSQVFEYAKNSSNGNMLFTGNYKFQNLIVMNLLPVPVTTQFLRINPITAGYQSLVPCLRAEVYGYHPECSDDLTVMNSIKLTASSSISATYVSGSVVHSRYAWCAATSGTNEYITIDLGTIRRITGFGVQGDTGNDQWPTKVKIGVSNDSTTISEMATEYIGSIGRFDVTRHWFEDRIYARYIRFRPTAVNGGSSVCMRIQVLGCAGHLPGPTCTLIQDNIVKEETFVANCGTKVHKVGLEYSRVPLGLSNGFVKNDQFTATSQYAADNYAYTARLKLTGIRWCSVNTGIANYSEYVQVDFRSVVKLTGVATQGDDNHNNNYPKKYYLEVSMDGTQYTDVKGIDRNRQVFTGNTDNNGIVYNWLDIPTNTRYVRFRASDISGTHVCVRLEFYGNRNSKAADKTLYPLGLESGVIEDSQLGQSSDFNGNPAQGGRLNKANSAWCIASGRSSEWLQIDFKQPMVVTAIATQGHGGSGSKDRTYKYYLQYREVGSQVFEYAKNSSNGNMLFTGNYKFQQLIVMNLLPVPVTTQFLRINPITAGYQSLVPCLRAEVYGYHPACSDDVTSLGTINASSSSSEVARTLIYSPTTWCASSSDSGKYLEVDLKMPRMITGIGVQGDSNNEQWVKTFKLSHGLSKSDMHDLQKAFIGNNDRNSIVRNWLLPPLFTRYIRIKVETFETAACMRIQILGCANDHAVLRSITSSVENMRKVLISWDVVYNASSSFTLQYRKIDNQTWTEIMNLNDGSVYLSNLEKYQNYIVRLKSSNGILMLKNYVFGGTFSETSKFKLEIKPTVKPETIGPVVTTRDVLTIYWKQFTNNEILDWDIQGVSIRYNCVNDSNSKICKSKSPKEQNITDIGTNNFSATGLESFTNYTFTLEVYNSFGRGPSLVIDAKTSVSELQRAPEISKLRIYTSRVGVEIKEDKSIDVIGYRIAYRCITTDETRDCALSEWKNTTINSHSIELYGLVSWTKYELRITAYNQLRESPVNISFVTTLETAPSVPPSGFAVESVNATSLQFSWKNLKKNDTNGLLVAFTISLVRVSTSLEMQWNISNSLQNFTASGLKPYTNYSIRVAAVNRAGLGPYTDTILVETLQSAPDDSPTTTGFLPDISSAKILVTNIAKEKENGPLLGYKIIYECIDTAVTRKCSKPTVQSVVVDGSGKTELELKSLRSWTRYSVKVAVFNKIGDGPYSSVSNFTTLEERPGKSPKNVDLQVTGSRSLRLSWENLDWGDRNGIITLFSVRLDNESSLVTVKNVSSTDTSVNFTGLWPYSNYSAKVAAINSAGFGPYSELILAQTMEEAPGEAPTITNIATQKYSFSLAIKNINKRLEFGTVIGYHILYDCVPNGNMSRDCPTNSAKNVTISGYPSQLLTVPNLTSWTKYTVRIQIFNSAGTSRLSAGVEEVTKEDNPSTAPSDVTVHVRSSTSILVKWRQLAKQDTNGPITHYNITLRYSRRGVQKTMSLETTELDSIISNLFPYTVYSVSIKAKNSAGYGPESGTESNRTKEDAPSPPYDVEAIPQSSTSMKVIWKKPIDENGIIREYRLEYCNKNCNVSILLGNMTEAILFGLIPDSNYSFKVSAYTIKLGNWSVVVTEKTKEGIPSEPRSLEIATREATSLHLNWIEPKFPRGRIISYQIRGNGTKPYLPTFSEAITRSYICSPSCQKPYVLENLVAGTFYVLEIAATTSKGQGPYSLPKTGWTKIAAAPAPTYGLVEKSMNGGTERNITVNTVTNIYGPINRYEVIVQIRTGNEAPMISFPSLKSKADATTDNLNYYLAVSKPPGEMPLFMQITPGKSTVDAFGTDLETPGNYWLHFRAVSKRENEIVPGNRTVFDLARKFLKKLPEPDEKDVKAFTIKISLNVVLPVGFTASYFYIIAIKITGNSKIPDPSSYKQEDLKAYQPNSENVPYIAAILTESKFTSLKTFELGDGQLTKSQTKRRKRRIRATAEEYHNQPLDPESTYSVFIRALSTTSSSFSTPWTNPIKTKTRPLVNGGDGNGGNGIAIGIGIGVTIVVLLVAVVGLLFIRSRRRQKAGHDSMDPLDTIGGHELKEYPDGGGRSKESLVQKNGGAEIPFEPTSLKVTRSSLYPPFPAKDIVQMFNRKSATDDAGFNEEFGNLPTEQLFTWQVGGDIKIKSKNRFANIISYDFNRVKLKQPKDGCDYVNASYIVDYFGQRRYIASQAPVPKTVDDFWVMIWEQSITAIVMLTGCVEGTKKKSEQYWPLSGTEVYGNITVSYQGCEEYPDYVFTTLKVTKGSVVRTLNHLHFIAWPDYGVPQYPTSLLSFRRRMRGFIPWEKQGDQPIIVHCSAGVGRTGTFLAIDSLITLIERTRTVDVFGCVHLLRLQRSQMVQRASQYKFIYDCLLEATICGVTEISVQEFKQRYNSLSSLDPKTKKNGFFREFTSISLVAIEIADDEFSSGKSAANQNKNRDINVLPRNTQRIFLPSLSSEEGCNYINATYVDGNSKDQFIATQSPLENTIKDFWRMVIERESGTIVSLTEENESYPKYYPSAGQAHYDSGNISVELIAREEIVEGVTRSTLAAIDQSFNRSSSEVHHYHLSTWHDHSVPFNVVSLVSLIEAAESTKRRLSGGPIIVHCGNGSGRTGSFIAAYTLIERLKSQHMIDVFQTVRRLRNFRPSFVENKEQYKLLYDVVSCYLEQFSAYSNF